jgi:hypothetical protein
VFVEQKLFYLSGQAQKQNGFGKKMHATFSNEKNEKQHQVPHTMEVVR